MIPPVIVFFMLMFLAMSAFDDEIPFGSNASRNPEVEYMAQIHNAQRRMTLHAVSCNMTYVLLC